MIRGTFANPRLRNRLAGGREGWFTTHQPGQEPTTIFDASARYAEEEVPLIVIGGQEYGSGSSRDWAAKGPALLGVRAVLARSFERIHRSNLVGVGILPLQFRAGDSAETLGLEGTESYSLRNLDQRLRPGAELPLEVRDAGGREGGFTTHLGSGEVMSIYDAAVRYAAEGTPLIALAGKEYGSGSSRDWAAKGPALQGVRAVIAQSFERIHRSNLVGMGVLPLQFPDGESAETLGLDGRESFTIRGVAGVRPGGALTVVGRRESGEEVRFEATVRLDSETDLDYYRNGGILPMVLRQLAAGSSPAAG